MRPASSRTISVHGDCLPRSPFGTDYMLVHSLSGTEQLNQLFEYQLTLRVRDEYGNPAGGFKGMDGYISQASAEAGGSPGSNWDLSQVIGQTLRIDIQCDGKIDAADFIDNTFGLDISRYAGELLPARSGAYTRHIHALITQAQYSGNEGRSALYLLTLRPWTWLMSQTRNYRIYQNQTAVQTIRQVLEAYGYPFEFHLERNYPSLDYQVQYGESDYDFMSRLAQEHGINLHYRHDEQGHRLILSDSLAIHTEQPSAAYQTLYTYPPQLKLQEEYLHTVHPRVRHTVGQIHLSDYAFKTPQADISAQAQQPRAGEWNQLEVYEWQQGDYTQTEQGQERAQRIQHRHHQHGHRARAHGNTRGIQVGYRFKLANHPTEDANIDWLVLGQRIDVRETAPESNAQHFQFHSELLLAPANQTLVPDRTVAKPRASSQSATVVGPAEQEVWTDRYGRVKVRFHWHRDDPADETSTCWLRSSSLWAGNEYGNSHIPRIGQEVLVQFINADPDLPLISGRLSNPEQMPPWQLPSQHALSGFRSKEIHGTQYNKLILDDTTEQIQAQLGSDADTSELSLGHITRIADNAGRTDHRGQGFELRTDGHGAIRAQAGLHITTYSGDAHLTELADTAQLLQSAHARQKSLTQAAIDHQAEERSQTAEQEIEQQNQQIAGSGQQDELSAPHIVLSAPAGIAVATPKTIHLASQQHNVLSTAADLSMSVGKRLIASVGKGIRLFTQSAGIQAIAGKGKVQIQAQSDEVEFIAEQVLRIISAKKSITFAAAEEILVTAGGSYFKINGAGIEHGTTGNYTIYAAQHPFTGPNQMEYEMPKDPYDNMFVITHPETGEPIVEFPYKITTEDGTVYRGVTNEQGQTMRFGTGFQSKGIKLEPDDGLDET